MDPTEIRRTAIIAMFSDDVLMDRLVLKGGNALDLVHHLTARGSLDIDFSMEGDFEDLADIQKRIFAALHDRFDSAGHIVFDEKFLKRPSELREGQDERWGGYRVEFKVIAKELASKLDHKIEQMRVQAASLGYAPGKVFCIEISRYEFCGEKVEADFDEYTIYVYPPQMIAAEKLRAICQQMPEYPQVKNKRARARDFYDLHTVITRAKVDLDSDEFKQLMIAVFDAKTVPLELLAKMEAQREIHRPDWPSVELALTEKAESFDYYFDFVLEEVKKLKTLWEK